MISLNCNVLMPYLGSPEKKKSLRGKLLHEWTIQRCEEGGMGKREEGRLLQGAFLSCPQELLKWRDFLRSLMKCISERDSLSLRELPGQKRHGTIPETLESMPC